MKSLQIKTHFAGLLLFPSLLCLDAPLAAAGWAACLEADRAGRGLPEMPQSNQAALFLATWTLYLIDRLLEGAGKREVRGDLPRMFLATRHRRGGWLLAGTTASLLLFAVAPGLERGALCTGAILSLAVCLYYILFRISRPRWMRASALPAKELIVGTIFAAGTGLMAAPGVPEPSLLLPLAAMGALFTGNCLLIARAERSLDQHTDLAAFYAEGGRARTLPEWLSALALAAAPFCGSAGFGLSAVSLAGAGLGTLILARVARHLPVPLVQPLADLLQLFPWVVIGSKWFLEGIPS